MTTPALQGPVVSIALDDLHFDLELQIRHDRYISVDLARDRVWEPFETRVFQALCEPGGCVIDIGANIGWYSIIASARVGPHGKVLAFEPEPANFALLQRNLARGSATGVIARQLAVGSRRGTTQLFLSDDNLGDHRLFEGAEKRRSTPIEVTTLNDALANVVPTLVKCDTQGSELDVVEGCDPDRFDPATCAWIVEFWPHGLAGMGAAPEELLRWFDRFGYRFYEVSEGNPRLVATDAARLMNRVHTDLTRESQMFINLLLIHPNDQRCSKIAAFET